MGKEECKCFGNMDGMDGSCHYCFRDNRDLWDLCEKETFLQMNIRHKKFMKNLQKQQDNT